MSLHVPSALTAWNANSSHLLFTSVRHARRLLAWICGAEACNLREDVALPLGKHL